MAVFIELALPRHAREPKPRLPLRAVSLISNSKVEPRTRSFLIARVLGVLRHTQVPRAVPGSLCVFEVRVVETAVEDEAVDVVVRQ